MNFKVNSSDFASCMNKIYPAVSITKDKKEVVEGSIRISVNSQQRTEKGHLSIAVAFDGKKQLLCAFMMQELEMEEEAQSLFLNGRKLYEISNVFNNGKDCPTMMEVGKDCRMTNGTSEVRFPLSEENVILCPEECWLMHTVIPTDAFLNLLRAAGSFYSAADDSMNAICLEYDMEEGKLAISSSDLFKIGYGELAVEYDAFISPEEDGEEDVDGGAKEEPVKHVLHAIEGDQLKVLTRFLDGDDTELFIYKSQLFVKSASDVAIFLTKDIVEGNYPLAEIKEIANNHTGKAKIQMLVSDMLDALSVFNVANQEEQPYLHIGKEYEGMIYFQSKGKTGKTLVRAEIEGDVEEIILHAKLFRQLLSVYPKDAKVVLLEGSAEEPILIKEKEDASDFVMLTMIEE